MISIAIPRLSLGPTEPVKCSPVIYVYIQDRFLNIYVEAMLLVLEGRTAVCLIRDYSFHLINLFWIHWAN